MFKIETSFDLNAPLQQCERSCDLRRLTQPRRRFEVFRSTVLDAHKQVRSNNKAHKKHIRGRYSPLTRSCTRYCLTFGPVVPLQVQSCSGAASSAEPKHRRLSRCNTALSASPPCIVPRIVRERIGRSSTRKSASFSTWGTETCRCGVLTIRGYLFY
jgi:hypothetical protein